MKYFIFTGIIIITITIFFFLFLRKKEEKNVDVKYEKRDDSSAQKEYEKKKFPPEMNLSLQEKMELSWKFLYEITDTILKKFTKEDKKELEEIGSILIKYGMGYNHVMDYTLTPEIVRRQQDLKKNNQQLMGI